jgi:hypothetical protein
MNLIKFCHYNERFMDMPALSNVLLGALCIIYNTHLIEKHKNNSLCKNAKMQNINARK